ncbi:MAG: hypothetical protein MUW56_02515 [Chryseobacterium sp.]|uniref:hypothetical protein n=1 Tax=Chryseobacterium sp. TaxID=1871047 RepID=UPI0025B8532E|nr:hypothetical protein [Chryseobacterium sp.]MCJ7932522.1 hypothetical protein [Chryseobacterium sp.]
MSRYIVNFVLLNSDDKDYDNLEKNIKDVINNEYIKDYMKTEDDFFSKIIKDSVEAKYYMLPKSIFHIENDDINIQTIREIAYKASLKTVNEPNNINIIISEYNCVLNAGLDTIQIESK